MKPAPDEYPARYGCYLDNVPETEILEALKLQGLRTSAFLEGLTDPQTSSRHAPEKWGVKEVVEHLIDVERIFSMQVLRFSRDDAQPRMDRVNCRVQSVASCKSVGILEHSRIADDQAWHITTSLVYGHCSTFCWGMNDIISGKSRTSIWV